MGKILERIIKFSIYSLVFLMPLFLLPFSFEVYEFSKQYLIFFLVSIGFIAWLSKMIFIDKEIRFRKTPLNILVFVFLLISIISAFFSIDKNSSLFGFYARFSNGLIALIYLGLFYFLLINNVEGGKQESDSQEQMGAVSSSLINSKTLLNLFLWSVFFVVLIAYFSVFGLWQNPVFSSLPLFTQQKTFNPVAGSLEGLSIFLSVVIVLLATKIVVEGAKKKKALLVFLIAMVVLMIIIDFNASWLVLTISLILFLIFALITRAFKENVNRLLLPIILILISITFLFINNFNQWTGIALSKEQVLSQSISWQTALKTITDSLKNAFLGSGIGTWHYDFSKFKPNEFNNTIWWQIRFDRAGSYASELLATSGILGFISYFFIIAMFFLVFWVLREKKEIFPYVMTFTALVITQFVYYQNTILAFSFWFILALNVISWQHRDKSIKIISLKELPELNLIFSTIVVLILLVVLVSYYFAIRFYLADVNYAKTQITFLSEERISLLEKAVILNPKSATYQIVLSRVYLSQLMEEITKPLTEQDLTKVQDLSTKAINQAKEATEAFPNSVAAWETSAMIYRDIQSLVSGTVEWSIRAFKEAIKLESKNPIFYTELGKLYLVSDDIQKARENFAKAKEFKSDYVDALLQDALIYERENDFDTAIKEIEEIVKDYPFNIDIKFQLGRLYFNQGEIDEAISQFEEIIMIVPNHSNSLYSLGLAYSRKGEKQKAIFIFEKVLELNPANQDIIQKLKELKGE